MVIGERTEGITEKRERHIKEMQEQFKGWSAELDIAIKKQDSQYANYCKLMLEICKNTIKKLEDFEI